MKVIDIAQRSPEWHAWRKEGISATSLAVILGKNPDKSRRQLWLELKGYVTPPDLSVIPQVRKGAAREPLALQAFEEKYGHIGLPICAQNDEYPVIRASFDGLLAGNVPVEIKNLSEQNHLDLLENTVNSSFVQLYQWQVKHQLVVSGGERGFLWFWSPKHEPVLCEVQLNQQEKDFIIRACLEFWQTVEDDIVPDADPLVDPLPIEELNAEQKRLWEEECTIRRELEQQIRHHKKALAELSEKAKTCEGKLRGMMGDYRVADSHGVRISQYDIRGKVNWEALANSLEPSLTESTIDSFRGQTTQGVRVTVDPNFNPDAMPAQPIPITRAKAKPKPKVEQTARVSGFWFDL